MNVSKQTLREYKTAKHAWCPRFLCALFQLNISELVPAGQSMLCTEKKNTNHSVQKRLQERTKSTLTQRHVPDKLLSLIRILKPMKRHCVLSRAHSPASYGRGGQNVR